MHSSAVFLIEFGAVILGLGLLGRLAGRFQFSPIPLYLLAGLAFGEGGLLPLGASEEFVAIGAEIGVVLLLLMLGLALLFTPAFTTGLNPLPPYLYSHGSAILATLQQVAGAAGTALLIAIMSGRLADLTRDGLDPVSALTGGLHRAFAVAAVISLGVIVCAFFMRNTQPDEPGHAESTGDEDTIVP